MISQEFIKLITFMFNDNIEYYFSDHYYSNYTKSSFSNLMVNSLGEYDVSRFIDQWINDEDYQGATLMLTNGQKVHISWCEYEIETRHINMAGKLIKIIKDHCVDSLKIEELS